MNDTIEKTKKRLAPFYLLQILRTETDEQHRLSQRELMKRLDERFEVKLNRFAKSLLP